MPVSFQRNLAPNLESRFEERPERSFLGRQGNYWNDETVRLVNSPSAERTNEDMKTPFNMKCLFSVDVVFSPAIYSVSNEVGCSRLPIMLTLNRRDADAFHLCLVLNRKVREQCFYSVPAGGNLSPECYVCWNTVRSVARMY